MRAERRDCPENNGELLCIAQVADMAQFTEAFRGGAGSVSADCLVWHAQVKVPQHVAQGAKQFRTLPFGPMFGRAVTLTLPNRAKGSSYPKAKHAHTTSRIG